MLKNHVISHYETKARRENGRHRDQLVKWNNLVKRNLISEAALVALRSREISILDLACGSAGDILKWHASAKNVEGTNINYIGVDNAPARIEEAKRRAATLLTQPCGACSEFTANFLCVDALEYLANAKANSIDIISCQFALNYLVATVTGLSTLFELVRRAMRASSQFILSVVDDEAVINELGMPEGGREGYFSLKPVADSEYKTGFMYSFSLHNSVDNCVEAIVCLDDILACAEAAGFTLDQVKPFNDFSSEDQGEFAQLRLHPLQKRVVALYTVLVFTTPAAKK